MKPFHGVKAILCLAANLAASLAIASAALGQSPVGNAASHAAAKARQAEWLAASPQQRVLIAEKLGEDGARAMAKSKGLAPIHDGLSKTIAQGPDQVYRGPDGTVHVFEAKGGAGKLGSAYGHPQGSSEWAVESAHRVLKSSKATAQQKAAAQAILDAASRGKLQVHATRTPHVLGNPGKTTVEQSVKTTEQAMKLAKQALKDGLSVSGKTTEGLANGAKSARSIKTAGGASGKALRGASKAAAVAGLVVDVGVRALDAIEVERQFGDGEITNQERVTKHAENAGGFAGGWGGAAAGATSGAAVGGAIGALFGGVGAPIGAAVGGFAGGIGGYFAGEGAGSFVAGRAAGAIASE